MKGLFLENTVKKHRLDDSSIKLIEELFGESFIKSENSCSVNIKNFKNKFEISLEIIRDSVDDCLISVYTSNTHLQLQQCTGFIVSIMLEEVIFISETEKTISGLIVSKQGDCSLYAGVSKNLLRKDFTELNSEKLLSAVALSIAESL